LKIFLISILTSTLLCCSPPKSDEDQIVRIILNYSGNPKLINQVSKYHGPFDISSLFKESIGKVIIKGYDINIFLNEQEIDYLISEETLAHLSQQEANRGLWTDILLDGSTFEIIDRSRVNDIIPDSKYYPFYTISNIRFDKQRRYALVHVAIADGFDSGGTSIYFFKKENGNWQLVESFERTVS